MTVDIQQSWADFLAMPFPEGCVDDEVDGICLVSVDTFAAGCIDTFISNRGWLDYDRVRVLERCRDDLERVLPQLEGNGHLYFDHLNRLITAILGQLKT